MSTKVLEPKFIVPFARYVLENAGHLEFPFRRYQIQPCWRGERPQEGRYRQFTQADIDVVGKDELPFHHDVEVMRVMIQARSRRPKMSATASHCCSSAARNAPGYSRWCTFRHAVAERGSKIAQSLPSG